MGHGLLYTKSGNLVPAPVQILSDQVIKSLMVIFRELPFASESVVAAIQKGYGLGMRRRSLGIHPSENLYRALDSNQRMIVSQRAPLLDARSQRLWRL